MAEFRSPTELEPPFGNHRLHTKRLFNPKKKSFSLRFGRGWVMGDAKEAH